ncbi:glycosyltransferase [Actinoplanes sp. NEAU-A12]|uniref:Glycosyltransferase n=1 Tax=Actinoplanes sandaracinus TaxID=3045177 RepID=A0ABT6WUG2_9ACTN|nr:glycosyltransferase [Actinoplanes sandaracinus]MDI6103349.1 glycosyltransferase [Actinoplanes sandaracinus]
MRICFVGKYPPIEGGVSTSTYWMVRGLAQLGHDVHVVTNAGEVEDAYRMTFEDDDAPWYQPAFPPPGGRVVVRSVQPFSRVSMRHIPSANPYVSRLAAAATDVVRANDCDVVLAYYLEPYAVAASMAATWTGRPLIIRHAGSDLDRLFRIPDLATTYREVLTRADAVVTRRPLLARFRGLGVPVERLYEAPAYAVPREVFHPAVAPLDLPIAGTPTIGIYGKVGGPKGTLDLIDALGRLAREGLDFHVAAMIGSGQARRLESAVRDAGITGRVHVLPLLPNWKVPRFIRACTAVCFLERDFPVVIHGPIVPREVLACGTCLVLSGEIAAKQRRTDLVHGENVLLVDDPKNREDLAATLRRVITRPAEAAAIGARAAGLPDGDTDHSRYVRSWEKILLEVLNGVPPAARPADAAMDLLPPGLVARIDPDLRPSPRESDITTAIDLCERAAERLGERPPDARRDTLIEALRYQRARLRARHHPARRDGPPFPAVDALGGLSVTAEAVGALRPIRGNHLWIETFERPVAELLTRWSAGVDGETVAPEPSTVLFLRRPNLSPCELAINDETRRLVDVCDGSRTTSEVLAALPEAAPEAVLAALGRLYTASVIIFADFRPGWGWTGGPRD